MGNIPGFNHFLMRFGYLFLAWLLALQPIFFSNAITKVSFCSTLLLFFVPLVIDYLGFVVYTKWGTFLKMVGAYTTSIAIVFVIAVSYEGISLDLENKMVGIFSFSQVWWGIVFWVGLSCADWIYFTRDPMEEQLRPVVVSKTREDFSYEKPVSMNSKIRHHTKKYEEQFVSAATTEGGDEE